MRKAKMMVMWPEVASPAVALCLEDASALALAAFGEEMAAKAQTVRFVLGDDQVPRELRIVCVLDLTLEASPAQNMGKRGGN